MPALARWSTIKNHAKTADDTVIEITNGKKATYKMLVSAGRNFAGLELPVGKNLKRVGYEV